MKVISSILIGATKWVVSYNWLGQWTVNPLVIGSSPILPADLKGELNMKVSVEDRRKIKDVKFLYPNLMSDTAKEDIIDEYNYILELEDNLDKEREYVRSLEGYLKEAREKFNTKSNLFTLEFEDKEVEHVDRTEVNLSVVNPTDASRKTYTGS